MTAHAELCASVKEQAPIRPPAPSAPLHSQLEPVLEQIRTAPAGLVPDVGAAARVLWLHDTDRWYLGDFLRHAAWLDWLHQNFPQASIDLAGHPAYLPLYGDGRFDALIDIAQLERTELRRYDLVVAPSSFPSLTRPDPGVRRYLKTWDAGWSLHAFGRRIADGGKKVLNYFRAAHPSTVFPGDGESDCSGTQFRFTPDEQEAAAQLLADLLPGRRPVLIYNPTASNPYTRQTDAIKEVDNTLTSEQHAAVLGKIVEQVHEHDILVAAPVKPADQANIDCLHEVAHAVPGVTQLRGADSITLRGYAALLADPRICGSIGAGTGSNTHLAALAGTESLSFERGADQLMLANWSQPDAFQMGSIRWRNPSPLTAVHLMRWDRLGEAEFAKAAHAALAHHSGWHSAEDSFAVLDLTPSAWLHFTDFSDEMAYLRHPRERSKGESLLRQLYLDSNLNKLARRSTDRR
ncbi:glycosyltransferase family 9 protein [Kineosporia babensis]|uniref:Uncharacterized protein n=1 Tax=Kineosporia babensis TaxID=499548 RepID=A0A9X1SYP9_9ACTN|nr:hypothetical protein [Kineosporia babensis]MCD5316570.1 hypothetical protein [Kineosporia babensis]